MRIRMSGIAAATMLVLLGCSSNSSEIPLPAVGHSTVVHGFAEVVGRGPGLLGLCVHKGTPTGPKRCSAVMYPTANPRCSSHMRITPITATLVREPNGGFHWLITELNGQAC